MASDIFAKIGDIKGESLDAKHKGEIDVLSFSWGANNAGSVSTGGGAGVGKATFHDLTFVHKVDKASPNLLMACATGSHYDEATLTHRKSGKEQQEFLIYKLNEVYITSVSHGGQPDGDLSESVSLQFAKVAVEYHPQKADGSLDAAVFFKYDIKGNKKI